MEIDLLNPSTTVCHLYFSFCPESLKLADDELAWTTCPKIGLGCCAEDVDGGGGAAMGIDKGIKEPLLDMINVLIIRT